MLHNDGSFNQYIRYNITNKTCIFGQYIVGQSKIEWNMGLSFEPYTILAWIGQPTP